MHTEVIISKQKYPLNIIQINLTLPYISVVNEECWESIVKPNLTLAIDDYSTIILWLIVLPPTSLKRNM